MGRAAAGLPQWQAACGAPRPPGVATAGAGGLRVSARRPETRPRGGGAGGAPAVSPLPQAGGERALRLAPQPASAPDPRYLLLLSAGTPPAAPRASAAVSRAGPAALTPPAHGGPRTPGRPLPGFRVWVGVYAWVCMYGGREGCFPLSSRVFCLYLNQLFGSKSVCRRGATRPGACPRCPGAGKRGEGAGRPAAAARGWWRC